MRSSYRNAFFCVCVYIENLCAFVNQSLMKVALSACLVIITRCSVSFMILEETEMHGCPIQKLFTVLCTNRETRYNDFLWEFFREELLCVYIYIDETYAQCVFVRLQMDLDRFPADASSLSKCHSLVNICHSSFTLLSAAVYCIVVHMQALTCMFAFGIQSISGRRIKVFNVQFK